MSTARTRRWTHIDMSRCRDTTPLLFYFSLKLEQDLIRNAGAEGGRPLVKRDPSWSTEPTGWSF